MTDEDAQALLAIADKVERASLANRADPEQPYVERGELARAIRDQVYAARRRVTLTLRVAFEPGTRVVDGREIPVVTVRRSSTHR